MVQFYKPGIDDSTINVSQDEVNKFLGGTATLQRSRYIEGVPPIQKETASPSLTSQANTQGLASSALPSLDQQLSEIKTAQDQARVDAEARKQARMAQINAQFGKAIEDQKLKGTQEISGATAQLGISRGLGASSSRGMYLKELENQNNKYIADLESKKAEALTNLDITSAEKLTEQIDKIREDAFKIRQQINAENLNNSQEKRAQGTYDLNRLEELAKSGITPTAEDFASFDKTLGGQGVAKQYFDALSTQTQSANQLAKAEDLYKVLNTIPQGTKINVGGVEYEGLKEVKSGNTILKEYDKKTGIATSITYDKDGKIISTDQKRVTPSGFTPKSPVSPNNPTPKSTFNEKNELKLINQAAQSVAGSDGKIAPWDYLKLRNRFVERGGSPTTFDTKMKGFRDPSNPNYPVGK